jgi:hypothetical protein
MTATTMEKQEKEALADAAEELMAIASRLPDESEVGKTLRKFAEACQDTSVLLKSD